MHSHSLSFTNPNDSKAQKEAGIIKIDRGIYRPMCGVLWTRVLYVLVQTN
jgi:hypothetical protein